MQSFCRSLLPAAILIGCAAPVSSWASGCNREIVVPIRFQQGSVCWQHVGVGTTFTGQFGAHQRVTGAALGQFYSADDNNRTSITAGPWQISVTGPDGFSASAGDNGQLDAILPKAGRYSISVGPCAIWGSQGMIEICAQ
jgi:hypothetical protein